MGRKRKEGGGSPSPVPRLEISVDEELDLHGMAVDEALAATELALTRNRSGATLRLIHGHSSGNVGSIRGALRRNLETVWKKKARSFRPEPGNPGATLVLVA
jgi:DNA-nicking Smr family endonuclease